MSVATPTGTIELRVDSIAAGGDGVGRAEGLVVFVPRTAAGDVAMVHIESTKRFARGRLETLIAPSADRVTPPCAHYTVDRCGGCQLQHVRYDAQLQAKRRIVSDSLQRIAKRTIDLPEIRRSDREWRYRTKLTLTMRRGAEAWTMGLHPFDDPVDVFQLEDCPITHERVVATWREIMAAAEHLPEAPALRGVVRLTGDDLVVLIRGGAEWPRSEAFFGAVSSAAALWWAPEQQRAHLVHERRPMIAGASFAQVNPGVARALQAYVLQLVSARGPGTVIDAYSGTGETAAALAERGIRVTAIEVDREAAQCCARRLPPDSRSLTGRVEDTLGRALPADVVIVNPPRIGLHERVAAALERARPRPRSIVYVSCDPATLARDLARLSAYRVESLVAFDMFPQTAHVEMVCELVPVQA